MEREMIEVRVNCEFEALVCLPGDAPQSWFQTARCIVHDTVEIAYHDNIVSVGSLRISPGGVRKFKVNEFGEEIPAEDEVF